MTVQADSETIAKRKKRIDEVIGQYEKRILALLNGRQKEELIGEDKKIFDLLIRASMYDPRRSDVGYGTKEMVEKGQEIAAKLDAMSEEEFMTSPFALEWIDILGEGMKITNMPIDNF